MSIADNESGGNQSTPRGRLADGEEAGKVKQKRRSMTMPPSEQEQVAATVKKPPTRQFRSARYIVESKGFAALTAVLTIYALIGDDIKYLSFNKPVDGFFFWATIVCLVVFSSEVVLSCIGKPGYFGGFFFVLDVVSTITLLLDLETVSGSLFGDNDIRSSRTAKLGSKAGRVARVLRLVRIFKLYKAIYEARQARRKREEKVRNPPGDEDPDDWDDINVDNRNETLQRESNVGKKLSELTIRKVIVLVLFMMLVVPFLSIEESEKFDYALFYTANTVNEALGAMVEARMNSSADEAVKEATMRTYHQRLLENVYFHNWYIQVLLKNGGCKKGKRTICFDRMGTFIFWVGINAPKNRMEEVREIAKLAVIPYDVVDAFEKDNSNEELYYTLGKLPEKIKRSMGEPWYECDDPKMPHTASIGFSLLGEKISGEVDYVVRCPDDLRMSEVSRMDPIKQNDFWNLLFWYDRRRQMRWEAAYALQLMAFVCTALLGTSLFFSNDANTLVLNPVEKMISKVEIIRENPLMAMKMADDEFKAEEMERAKRNKQKQHGMDRCSRVKDIMFCVSREGKKEPMETVVLEKTIIKLGSLLALGFGEAGSAIIEHNMSGVDSACVDAMIEGMHVECIIGATRIRDFGIATEVLQAKVMTFVNQIAEIVHGVVDEFHGASNKNNGDTFLTIWRTHDVTPTRIKKLADMSMLAVCRMLGCVHRSQVLSYYRGHPGIQQRLGRCCRITISSGLHYGWAIEGAVGSEFKIDASYLSPNVSIAETVERATTIYGVHVLVAESVVKICTPDMASKCRLVDRVVITGSVEPMEIYAIDLDPMLLAIESQPANRLVWNSRQRFKARQFLEAEKYEKLDEDIHMVEFFNENQDVTSMRFRYTLEFIHVFKMGYQNYSLGEWQVAQRFLSRTRIMLGVHDGPSSALLRFMEKPHSFQAPDWWQGVRDLGMAKL
eukprot:TRINITY_DN7975_c0_g2_i1.p1 TRINITY_DN7975_c0_g2~~TRINITY_DN7975_c0_g2_i1.p1  ORF type:complete len:952 (+),score=158.11 TRINITY_DN7975_c0_g2_i1:201-3056(+)